MKDREKSVNVKKKTGWNDFSMKKQQQHFVILFKFLKFIQKKRQNQLYLYSM